MKKYDPDLALLKGAIVFWTVIGLAACAAIVITYIVFI